MIFCPKGQFFTPVGDLIYLGQKFYNDTAQETQWWEAPNHTEPPPHRLANFLKLAIAWHNLTTGRDWQAPKGLYWTCGERAYTILPKNWFGSCVLGTFWPSFFPLPLRHGEKLGVSIYEERINRKSEMPYK
jgi:hypothetical protein